MIKEKLVLELIHYHCEHDEEKFNETVFEIAKVLEENGKDQLSDYILAQINAVGTFVPM